MVKILTIILAASWSMAIVAQEKVTGHVYDPSHKAIVGATVVMLSSPDRLITIVICHQFFCIDFCGIAHGRIQKSQSMFIISCIKILCAEVIVIFT